MVTERHQKKPPTKKTVESANTKDLSEPELPQNDHTERQESYFGTLVSKLSSVFYLPLNFFQSRPEIRTWGEDDLKDPSVQPRPDEAPTDYGTSLPGYPKHTCAYLDSTLGSPQSAPPEFVNLFTLLDVHDDKLLGPRLSFVKCNVNYPPLPPNKLGTPSYDYRNLLQYRMDYHPYVNAVMSPQDPARTYVCANWMVGYPYGVPAVEENEMA